jgi:predicted acetyltransferase
MLERLLQLYLHDLSGHAPPGGPRGDVGGDGLFAYSRLASCWREEGRVPLLIRAEGRTVGFALLNRW